MRTYIKDNASKVGFVAFIALAIAGCSGEDLTGDEQDPGLAPDDVSGEPAVSSDAAALALATDPNPDDVYINFINTGGRGCPDDDDVSKVLSEDRKTFTMVFDKMILEYPPGSRVKNLNCTAQINLHIPQGFQVSIASVNTRGYVFLPPGGRARQTSQYYFAGNPLRIEPHTDLVGPRDGSYTFTDDVPFWSLASECNAAAVFNVSTSINLNMSGAPNGTGIINTEEVDGKFKKVFHLMWRRC